MVNKHIAKLFSFLSLTTYYLLFAVPIRALYDPASVPNNKVGVHILHPSEISLAQDLVNSQGGSWGYITVPIQPSDRDLEKWQSFMDKAQKYQLIPIIRITTVPNGGTWDTAQDTDLVDFANFLNELAWPIQNRYIILFNEVNQSREWGGLVDPVKYANIVKNARTIFKERSADFFLLGPALDDSLPDSLSSMSAKKYLNQMYLADNAIWSYFDGLATHSYPNPGFSAAPKPNAFPGITSYNYLFTHFHLADKPVFITETGWDQTKITGQQLSNYWSTAWKIWNEDDRVVAVTPFVLSGGDAFPTLSLTQVGGNLSPSGEVLKSLNKVSGNPLLSEPTPQSIEKNRLHESGSLAKNYQKIFALHKLENIFRLILGLPQKDLIKLGEHELVVEVSLNAAQWEKGLSGRTELQGIDGMLFVFPQMHRPLFWMKNTLIPLDMIWIKDGVITEITPDVPPATSQDVPTYSPKYPVNMVLEVPAGWSQANNIQLGDRIEL